jgi:hypothetical protein
MSEDDASSPLSGSWAKRGDDTTNDIAHADEDAGRKYFVMLVLLWQSGRVYVTSSSVLISSRRMPGQGYGRESDSRNGLESTSKDQPGTWLFTATAPKIIPN